MLCGELSRYVSDRAIRARAAGAGDLDLDLAAGVSSSSLAGLVVASCRRATARRCRPWRGSWRSSPPAATSGPSPRGARSAALLSSHPPALVYFP